MTMLEIAMTYYVGMCFSLFIAIWYFGSVPTPEYELLPALAAFFFFWWVLVPAMLVRIAIQKAEDEADNAAAQADKNIRRRASRQSW